jgi:hypothetical protein
MKFGKKNITPERAAQYIRDHIADGLSRDADHAVEQHPELAVGRQLFEEGSARPASRGSGPVAMRRPIR